MISVFLFASSYAFTFSANLLSNSSKTPDLLTTVVLCWMLSLPTLVRLGSLRVSINRRILFCPFSYFLNSCIGIVCFVSGSFHPKTLPVFLSITNPFSVLYLSTNFSSSIPFLLKDFPLNRDGKDAVNIFAGFGVGLTSSVIIYGRKNG